MGPYIKCGLVGDSGVGKSNLMMTCAEGVFPQYVPEPEMFCHFVAKHETNGKQRLIPFTDIYHSAERFEKLRVLSYPNQDVLLVCFALDNRASFDCAKNRFVPEIQRHCSSIPIIVVGTKLDVRRNGGVSYQEGKLFAEEISASNYIECSSMLLLGLDKLLEAVVFAVTKKMPPNKNCCHIL